jgi:hypothetical protein
MIFKASKAVHPLRQDDHMNMTMPHPPSKNKIRIPSTINRTLHQVRGTDEVPLKSITNLAIPNQECA